MSKEIYSIPKFKKLNKEQKVIFVLSFVIPILIIYLFLHFYFLPFGYDAEFDLDSPELTIEENSYFYQKHEDSDKEVLDGRVNFQVETGVPKRNVHANISVEGEDIYLTPFDISDNDISFNSEFSKEFEEDFDYKLLDEYNIDDEKYLTFKIEYTPEFEEIEEIIDEEILEEIDEEPQVLLSYKNILILQYSDRVEMRSLEKRNESIEVYSTGNSIEGKDYEKITLYAIYKKPREANGFLEIISNKNLSTRTIIPTNERLQEDFDSEKEIVWNEQLKEDISQEYISLKQEQYTHQLIHNVPEVYRDRLDPQKYYEELYLPYEQIDYQELEETERVLDRQERERIEKSLADRDILLHEAEKYGQVYIETDEDEDKKEQVYYDKDFYDSFEGTIEKLSVGYEYPLEKRKEITELFPQTPFTFRVVGENSKIEDISVNLQREAIWEKF